MDEQFTNKLKAWVDAPDAERDYEAGALMLLQLSRNRIMYNNISRAPERYAGLIRHELNKYLKFRLAKVTREQVAEMAVKVEAIAEAHKLTEPAEDAQEPSQLGRRADHDSLPEEIQACFTENLKLLRKMRDLHVKLRSLSLFDAPCPDSERYPFLKELIRLDKKLHANWEKYDTYGLEGAK